MPTSPSSSKQLQISAKNLGELAMPNFCPRCFWIKLHTKLPYQIFPGIFSSIDTYTKNIVHSWFEVYGCAPSWLGELGDIIDYKNPPSHQKFRYFDEDTNITLTGVPDGILVASDYSHIIIDYKTAKYTGNQDNLFPMYEVQLNAYAQIAERCGFDPVSGLALIYFEPMTDLEAAADKRHHHADGFSMGFEANVLKVEIKRDLIPNLLAKTREIYDVKTLPDRHTGCENCVLTDTLANLIGHE
jgi:hypothetical protein